MEALINIAGTVIYGIGLVYFMAGVYLFIISSPAAVTTIFTGWLLTMVIHLLTTFITRYKVFIIKVKQTIPTSDNKPYKVPGDYARG